MNKKSEEVCKKCKTEILQGYNFCYVCRKNETSDKFGSVEQKVYCNFGEVKFLKKPRMKKETIKALSELAKAAARLQGLDENNIEFTVCNTTEPNVCDKHCNVCEGQTHHWMDDFLEDEDGEIINPDQPVWKCKHCPHWVLYGETESHPSGCDCPDCMPDEDEYFWCGNSNVSEQETID